MADLYGTDIACLLDVGPTLALAGHTLNIGYAMARRLSTPEGSLSYDLTYGYDVRNLLNASSTSNILKIAPSKITRQCLLDERIASCAVTFNFNYQLSTLTIGLQFTLSDGSPFSLVLAATAVSVTLLKVQ